MDFGPNLSLWPAELLHPPSALGRHQLSLPARALLFYLGPAWPLGPSHPRARYRLPLPSSTDARDHPVSLVSYLETSTRITHRLPPLRGRRHRLFPAKADKLKGITGTHRSLPNPCGPLFPLPISPRGSSPVLDSCHRHGGTLAATPPRPHEDNLALLRTTFEFQNMRGNKEFEARRRKISPRRTDIGGL